MMAITEDQLLEYINAMSLALVDTTEFLDTHPDDREALKYFLRTRELLDEAKKEYCDTFCPLYSSHVNGKHGWDWIDGKWPWEGGC